MNRMQPFSAATRAAGSGSATPEVPLGPALFAPARGETPCALFAPLHYEPNYAYPLLVWLHGPDDSEGQLKRIMPFVSLRNYVAVAARGTVASNAGAMNSSYAWSQTRAHVAAAEQRVFESIELAARRFNVARERVFLAGFDGGGTMAFRLAMAHPREFAGVLSINGPFPAGRRPLVRLIDARRIPVFLACGRDSDKYPTASVCDNLKLFHSAGMQVALRQYPCGHQITSDMLSDMDRWLMEQITGQSQLNPTR
jgi:phospholipase/carboxylesterase